MRIFTYTKDVVKGFVVFWSLMGKFTLTAFALHTPKDCKGGK